MVSNHFQIRGCKLDNLRSFIRKIYIFFKSYIKNICFVIFKIEKNQQELYSLSPKENLNDEHYQKYADYLRNSLKNNEIKNIAITGKYGSGKSTIINSYFKQHGDNNVLRVSFASFKGKSDISHDDINNEDSKTEQSIINQILYQIKPQRIPLTNFKIKRPMNWIVKSVYVFESLLFILIVSWFINKSVFHSLMLTVANFVKTSYDSNMGKAMLSFILNSKSNYFISLFILLFLVLLSWNIWLFLGHFQIHHFKLTIKSLSADIDLPNEDLFEKYIDEIIYIFQHSKKHILILEDIDRFEKIGIFQKLRELNVKLNVANNGKKQWKFIYLIRDDIFNDVTSDKALTRVKFFDLIIPIIPFVTKSNSYDKIATLFKGDNLNSRLIDIVSNYIDDYRLLLNIKNEFTIFLNRLAVTDKNQLFALIAYKNIFPDQFDTLQNGGGVLKNLSLSFKQKINNHKEEILSNINQLETDYKQNIADSENEILLLEVYKSGNDAYSTSVSGILSYKNYGYHRFLFPYDRNNSEEKKQQTVQEFMQTDYFKEKLALATDETYYLEQQKTFEKKLDNLTKESWQSVSRADWLDIIGTEEDSQSEDNKPKEKIADFHNLLFGFISNGFINEHYLEVINKYYGNINNSIFKKNLLEKHNDKEIDFSLRLSDLSRLVLTLYGRDFDEKAILNYSLFQYYLTDNNAAIVRRIIQTAQKNKTDFIENYLDINPSDFDKIREMNVSTLKLKIRHIKTKNIFMQVITSKSYSDTEQNVIDATNFIVENNLSNEEIDEILKSDSYISLKEQLIRKSNKKYDVSDDFNPEIIRIFFKYDKIVGSIENFNKYVAMMDLNEPSFNFDNLLAKYFNKHYEDISSDLNDKEIFDSMLKSSLITDETFRWSFEQYKKHGLPNYDSSIINDAETNSKINILLELGLVQFDSDVLGYIIKNGHSLLEYYKYDYLISELVKTKYENSKIDLRTINKISDYPDSESFVVVSRNLNQYGSQITKIISLLLKFTDQFDDAKKVIKILENKKGAFQSHLSNDEAVLNILGYLKDTNFVSDFQLVDDKYFMVKR